MRQQPRGRRARFATGTERLESRELLDSTVVFSELMYHPADNETQEWIELQNLMAVDMDLSGWQIEGIDFHFPANTIISAGDFLVVAKTPANLQNQVDAARLLGPYAGQLSNAGEQLRLINNSGRTMDELSYDDDAPWPVGADGSGATLAKLNPNGGTSDVRNWRASRSLGGTPGSVNFPTEPASDADARAIVFSEIAGSGNNPSFLEIVNRGATARSLQGYTIRSSNPEHAPFSLPAQELPAGGFRAFSAQEIGFSGADGDALFLLHGTDSLVDAARASDNVRARRDWNFETGTPSWLVAAQPTPGAANNFALESDIVINEIMYHAPGSGPTADQPATYDVTPLFELTNAGPWRYRAASTGLAPDWHTQSHSIGADSWQSGSAPIGFDRNSLPIPLVTQLPNPATIFPPIRTFYFEREFQVTLDASSSAELLLRHYLDDGAVFYLNGVEVARVNMPSGDVNSTTLALQTVDATPSDLLVLPSEALVSGVNRLSVEVHQDSVASNDVVFSAALYLGNETSPFVPGQPFRTSNEEWIELFNRSETRTIDLSGWQLADAVAYEFAPGTMLGPGEYLVVASDPAALRTVHPTLSNVVGPFDGQLSNRTERIQLLDAVGNPADEVTYFDAGPWPSEADGGGASLELRDPWADNDRPEAWAAAIPAELPAWTTIRYRGIAGPDGFTNGVTNRYHEFIFGLLNGGVVLIDDISVVENPQAGAIERVQNGSFTNDPLGSAPATWRLVGNHGGSVVLDPHDATNQVLELRASGAMEDRSNHAETTFADSGRIREGTEYEISFRALSISGSNQLHSRLFLDRMPRTSILPRTPQIGSPGTANRSHATNIGPTYESLLHDPAVPAADEPVTVSVVAEDPQGIATMRLWYKVDEGAFESVPMTLTEHGRYEGTIPGQTSSRIVQFYVEGHDQQGVSSLFPAAGAQSRALYKVQDNRASSRGLHNFRIIMTPDDTRLLHRPVNQMSNGRIGATVIYNESEIFYDVGVRLKGSNAGRSNPTYLGFNVEFNPNELFRGVHDSVAIDRSGRSGPTPATQDEILIKHIGLQAGNIPHMYDDLVHVIAPDVRHSRTALLMMARYGDVFLDSQFENGSDGTVFRLDIAYVSNTTEGNRPEGLKIAFPYSHPQPTKDLEDLGDDKESYRTHLRIRNNRAADDYRAIIAAAKALDLTGPQQVQAAAEVLDIDQWTRVFALQSLTGAADVYTRGELHHNIDFYVRPSDQRVLTFPWDWDFAFTGSTSQPLIGTSGTTGRLMNQPTVRRLYYGHLYDIIERTFNNEYLDRWIDHYGQVAGQNLGSLKNYVRARRTFVLSRLPAEVPFAITTNNGMPVEVETPQVTLQGNGWINVRAIRLAGSTLDLPLRWSNDETWQVDVPLRQGTQEVVLQAFDHQERMVGSAAISVSSTVDNPLAEQLRLTELNYHPHDPTPAELAQLPTLDDNDFEFIELYNAGDQPLYLDQVKFTEGVDLTFKDVVLAAGEVAVIVSNEAAFRARYGNDPRVIGEFNTSALSNAGEQLTLVAADGTVLIRFAYDDAAPWTPLADGQGHTLELIDVVGTPSNELGQASVWRASVGVGGSPGSIQLSTLPGDLNQDQQVDVTDLTLLCFAIRTQSESIDLNNDGVTNHDDLAYLVESILDTQFGDVNLDGRFDSRDLVLLFQRGHYHDAVPLNSGWADGDWNCDGEFTSSDLVLALQRGPYETGEARRARKPL